MIRFSFRKLMAVFAVTLALGMLASTADARVGGGVSAGSRGSRTFSAPPATNTAPSPRRRSSAASPSRRGRPSAPALGRLRPGFFGRGLLGGLAAGFIGAGLFGLLFGHGLFGGLGGFASMFGLILQIGLVVLIGRFLWSMWARRQQPAMASGPSLRDAPAGGAAWAVSASAAARRAPVGGQYRRLAGRLRCVRAAARRDPDRLQQRGSRRDARAGHARDAVLLLRATVGEREPRRREQGLRRQAAAGRSRRSLARGQRRVRDRGDALRVWSTARSIVRAAGWSTAARPRRRSPSCGPSCASGHGNWLLSAIQQT